MSRFVSSEAVAVHTPDDMENVIYIKPRMDLGTNAAVRSAMMQIQAQASMTTGAMSATKINFDIAAYNVALLTHNIVRWTGPDFDNVPCNAENIQRIDPDDELLELVLREINERNKPRAKDPKLSSASGKNGSKPTGAPGKAAVAVLA